MLNRYRPEEIVPALSHHNGRVRRYAAMMMGIGGEEQLVNFLVNLLPWESAPARRAAARALEISIRPLPDAGRPAVPGPAAVDRLAVESLTAAFRNPDALVRVHAADALQAFSAPALLPALLPMLQDPEEAVRFAAAVAAGDLGAPQSLPVLIEALRRGPPHRRGQAAASLRVLRDAAAVPALMDAVNDPSGAVWERVPALIDAVGASNIMAKELRRLREDLVNALGLLARPQGVPALIRALDDCEKHVRGAALPSLARLGTPQAEDARIDLVDRNTFHARPDIFARAAIRKLDTMGVGLAMPMLRLAMEERQLKWAPVVARALRQLGDTITAGDMLGWLSSRCSQCRLPAVLALPALVNRDALPHSLSAVGDGDAAVRAAAARELGHLDYGSAIPVLTDALQGEGEVAEVREAICGALAFLAKGRRRQSAAAEAG